MIHVNTPSRLFANTFKTEFNQKMYHLTKGHPLPQEVLELHLLHKTGSKEGQSTKLYLLK